MHQHTQQLVCNESWDEISNHENKQKASTLTAMSEGKANVKSFLCMYSMACHDQV